MTRRAICGFLLLGVSHARAATREQVLAMVAPLATALSSGDAGAFMANIPDNQPDRAALAANVEGLLAAALVTSSVQPIEIGERQARLDWYMQIQSRATGTLVERRREAVIVAFADAKLVSIQPISAFRPPRAADTN